MALYWVGVNPKCDFCSSTNLSRFVDGKTHGGPWAIMCPECFLDNGVGLGTGRGQSYKRVGEDQYVKVMG